MPSEHCAAYTVHWSYAPCWHLWSASLCFPLFGLWGELSRSKSHLSLTIFNSLGLHAHKVPLGQFNSPIESILSGGCYFMSPCCPSLSNPCGALSGSKLCPPSSLFAGSAAVGKQSFTVAESIFWTNSPVCSRPLLISARLSTQTKYPTSPETIWIMTSHGPSLFHRQVSPSSPISLVLSQPATIVPAKIHYQLCVS